MHRSDRLGMVAGAVVGLLVAVTLHMLGGTDAAAGGSDATPAPTPEPGVTAPVGEIRTFPDQPASRRSAIGVEIHDALVPLYEQAFIPPPAAQDLTPTPAPTPSDTLAPFFTGAARAALAKTPDVFRPGAGVRIDHGRLLFRGVTTMRGSTATRALVNIEFRGSGSLASDGTPARVKQAGQLLLLKSGGRWVVSGFDLKLRVDRAAPGPSDPRRVAPLAEARWNV